MDSSDLPTLYAAWKSAVEARDRAEFGSPVYLIAAKEAARVYAEARKLSGEHKPFVRLEDPMYRRFLAPTGTGRRGE